MNYGPSSWHDLPRVTTPLHTETCKTSKQVFYPWWTVPIRITVTDILLLKRERNERKTVVNGLKQFLNPTGPVALDFKAWLPALFWAHGFALKATPPFLWELALFGSWVVLLASFQPVEFGQFDSLLSFCSLCHFQSKLAVFPLRLHSQNFLQISCVCHRDSFHLVLRLNPAHYFFFLYVQFYWNTGTLFMLLSWYNYRLDNYRLYCSCNRDVMACKAETIYCGTLHNNVCWIQAQSIK